MGENKACVAMRIKIGQWKHYHHRRHHNLSAAHFPQKAGDKPTFVLGTTHSCHTTMLYSERGSTEPALHECT